jgi:hypothetical protein
MVVEYFHLILWGPVGTKYVPTPTRPAGTGNGPGRVYGFFGFRAGVRLRSLSPFPSFRPPLPFGSVRVGPYLR